MLKGLRSEAGHLLQLRTRTEASGFIAISDNLFSESRADSGDIAQQIRTCGIKIDTDAVHTLLHSIVKFLLEEILVDIVLILPYA